MLRNDLPPVPDYFAKTIALCENIAVVEVLETMQHELLSWNIDQWKLVGDKTYQSGKWTVADILQHLIDTTWIFSYRALCFARGEIQQLPYFEEDMYAREAKGKDRNLDALVKELNTLYASVIALFQSFDKEKLLRTGISFKGEYTVASIAFILAGHQRWHFRTLEERYLPLIQAK